MKTKLPMSFPHAFSGNPEHQLTQIANQQTGCPIKTFGHDSVNFNQRALMHHALRISKLRKHPERKPARRFTGWSRRTWFVQDSLSRISASFDCAAEKIAAPLRMLTFFSSFILHPSSL